MKGDSFYAARILAGLMLTATGCGQAGQTAAPEGERILSVESVDTENLFLLERMEHCFRAGEENAAVELYTSAQVAAHGQMGWDSEDQWALLVRQGNRSFVLYDECAQYGEVQFWVSRHNPAGPTAPDPKAWRGTCM